MKTKICRVCKKEKSLDEFYNKKTTKDGKRSSCKKCNLISNKIWCAKHKKERALSARKYREKYRDIINERQKLKYKKNPNKYILNNTKYKKLHPDKIRAHEIIRNEIERKRIIKPDFCEVCNSNGKLDAHHDDYSKPLIIRWLCRFCHQQIHKGKYDYSA